MTAIVRRRRLWSLSTVITIALICHVSSFVNGDNHPLLGTCAKSRLSTSNPIIRHDRFTINSISRLTVHGGETSSTALQQSQISDGPSSRASSYYLLWSPGFCKKFGLMTLGLVVLHISRLDGPTGKFFSRGWHNFPGPLQEKLSVVPKFILPLLSSSCCLLQLLINVVVGAGGCAGFNTILGPFRPYFLSFLAYLNWFSRPEPRQALLHYAIALMPEFVHFWNRFVGSQWNRRHGIAAQQNPSAMSATVEVDIPTMGCVACINKIESSLRQCAPTRIVEATSWLDPESPKGGRAKVKFLAESQEDLDSLARLVVDTIGGAGFGGSSVARLEFNDSKP
jgi:hypothetical protein